MSANAPVIAPPGPPGPPGPSGPAGPPPVEPTSYEVETYKTVAQLYDSEETTFWVRNTVLVALQTLMLGGAGTLLGTFAKDLPPNSANTALVDQFLLALAALCAVGLAISIIWISMVRRGAYISHVIERRMIRLEKLFKKKYGIVKALRPYTFWSKALLFNHKRRHDEFGKRYFLAGFRLSYAWTCVGILFLLAWLFLSYLGWRLYQSEEKQPVPITPVRDLTTLVQFAPFAESSAERTCGVEMEDQQAIATILTAIQQITANKLTPLVILIGGTDREPLSKRYRKQYESNQGLAQARATAIKHCLVNAIEVTPRAAVQFVTLDAGPVFTPAPQQDAAVEAQERSQDRRVRALIIGIAPTV